MVQPALYDGDEILKTHYVPVSVTSSEEDLEIAEITRQKMNEKMNDPVCVEKKIKIILPNYSKEIFFATFTPQTQLTPEQVFWSKDLLKQGAKDLKTNSPPLPILPPATVYPPNTPVHMVPRTLPTKSQVNIGERGFEQTKRCYLTEVIPFFNLLKEHFDEVQRSLVKEVRAIKAVFENMEAEVDQNDVFYTVTDSNLTASRFHDLSNAYNVAMTRVVKLEAENSKLLEKIQDDDHDTMIKDFSKLEIAHLNLQLKHQHLKENIENFKSKSSKDVPEFDAFFELGKRDDQIQGHKNTIPLQEQLEHFKAENEKVKQHYQELFNSIKITRVKTIERTTSLQTKIENLKTQLKGKVPSVTSNVETSKDTLDTLREIVEEARSKRPSDHSLDYACVYTKRSQELLENVSASCPKARNKRDKVIATTPLTRKKHVTFADPLETSGNNTTNHVKHPTVQKTNVPIIHSTGVSNATKARRSQSKSNKMNDKTLPANSVPEKKVEDHHRKNKSKLSKKNRVDSSTSVRRTVFNTNSNSLCKTCKVFTTVGYHWKPTGRIFPLGAQCPLTRNTKPKVVPVKQWKPTGRLILLGGQCPLVRPTALNRGTMPADPQGNNTPVVQIVLWYLDSGCSKHMTGDRSRLRNFVKKFIGTVRFGNDHFGAIMGYEDYVISDNVISRVYNVEGLGHNIFSVGQFCDSDLEVTFRKYTRFVKDLDGVDLIKGSRGTNLYTISVEDMMRSSPICLLFKASKNKSWLWHHSLNHLNFGTLNDLARKDLVRGLPRLKFEKDHLCSACQLGKSRKATHKPKMVNTIMEVLRTLHMDLCGPIRVKSINGKKYILIIVDDYSKFTWVKFLRSKDETLKFVVKLLKQLQVSLNKTVRNVRTDNGTEFVNKDLTAYYKGVGITHKKTILRTPQQNNVVERRNCTLVEAARTMLIFSKALIFLWAEAIATAYYTQN
ncbi:retrovirus-related pol polyprotein from transposon TNT 1-94 [Tanacetum coccineum]